MTLCAIHQPNFLPYYGFFDKIANSDKFIIYDDAQFVKRDFHNKNFILLDNKKFRLSVPIKKSSLKHNINEILIDNEYNVKRMNWKDYHLLQFKNSYKDTKNFDYVYTLLNKVYSKNFKYLVNFNIEFIKLICNLLNINTTFELSSVLSVKNNIETHSTLKLIELCKSVGADTYLSGSGGKSYLDESLFLKHNIILKYQDFKLPYYKQNSNIFVKNLSILDYL
ncbi:MAG: WbqC family protein, partial [Nanoarchaeota archaeon]